MPTQIEPLRDLADQILTDIESKTNQDTPPVNVAWNRLLSNSVAALSLTNKLHNVDQRKECFPQTATENVGLTLWAALTDRPKEDGDRANLQTSGTGVDDTVIGTGSTGPLLKAANGVLYQVSEGDTISGGVSSIAIIANQSGEEGTLKIGDTLRLTSTLVGVDPEFTVTAINTPGTEPESIDSWRAAIIQIAAFPPQIGTSAWFATESLTVDGITRVYPYSDDDFPGRVEIFLVADGNVDGIPSGQQLADVEAVFTFAGKDILWATGILPNLEKRIESFESPIDDYNVIIIEGAPALSATMKEAVEASIENYFTTRNPFIKGLSLEDQGTVEKIAITTAAQNTIDAETGDTGRIADIDLQKVSEPAADAYTLEKGHRADPIITYT